VSDFSIIRCPICKGKLDKRQGLNCKKCSVSYPIKNGIPVMIPEMQGREVDQDLAVEKKFYEEMFSNLKGFEDGHCIVYGKDRLYDYVSGIERGTMLEAGCGGGHHGVTFAEKGFDVTAVDLSFNAVSASKKLAEHRGVDILYTGGDILRLPFEDNQFDICFCSLILHHFMHLDGIVSELLRVTRKHFVAYEVNALDPISFVRFNVLNPLFGLKYIVKNQRALFPGKLEGLLRSKGFDIATVQYDDVRDTLGKTPKSLQAKGIQTVRKILSLLPNKYSSNKFLIHAVKKG